MTWRRSARLRSCRRDSPLGLLQPGEHRGADRPHIGLEDELGRRPFASFIAISARLTQQPSVDHLLRSGCGATRVAGQEDARRGSCAPWWRPRRPNAEGLWPAVCGGRRHGSREDGALQQSKTLDRGVATMRASRATPNSVSRDFPQKPNGSRIGSSHGVPRALHASLSRTWDVRDTWLTMHRHACSCESCHTHTHVWLKDG